MVLFISLLRLNLLVKLLPLKKLFKVNMNKEKFMDFDQKKSQNKLYKKVKILKINLVN